ncbi:MAG: tetratricopeptide repeat protein [Gammaproteobacteria bacterium]|nr:tetratricopeptide repeat protein [Gammaproteobacteria bacterium]NNC96872.1 tetratricopeptide repeat protein [Gammaproteobacteria bacterium]NNM13017.1 tetratricopeptide repeat protein [Gammaproteobacteria bacterium]
MSEYLSDAEQKQQIVDWWNENGKFIVTGVGLGLVAIFAWRGWTAYLDKQAGAASIVFEDMVTAVNEGESDTAKNHLSTLTDKYKSTAYYPHAQMLMAKVALESGNLADAATALEQAISTSKDAELTELANFRLAKVYLAQQNFDAALTTIAKVKSESYIPLVEELRGDIFRAQGNINDARFAYEKAQTAMLETPIGDPNLLQMKLSDLGKK